MADPFAILQSSQFSIPQLVGIDMQMKDRRLDQLFKQRQIEKMDRDFEKQTTLAKLFAGEKPKGGDPASGSDGAGTSPASPAPRKPPSPDEVWAIDPEMGKAYAEYRKSATEADIAQNERLASATVRAHAYIKSLPKGEQRTAAWQEMMPVFAKLGADQQTLASIDPNKDQQIDGMAARNKMWIKAGEDYTLGRTRFSGVSNTPIASVPEEDKWIPVPAGGFVQRIPGGGGMPSPAPTEGAAPPSHATGKAIETAALSIVPGATVTSGARTPERNREVGGVSNSYHLTDQARDLVPPRGMTMAQFHQTLKSSLPGFDVINEGDHVHIEPKRGAAAPAQADRIYGQPKPQYTLITADEAKSLGLDPSVVWQRGPEGQIGAVPGQPKASETDQPYSQSALDAFDRAISSAERLKAHPGMSAAVGVRGLTGGLLGGWTVPGTAAADFRAELEAMKAQVFLPMVQSMKGMGALSNAEGQKLTDAIGALDPDMSEKSFASSLDRIVSDLKVYRDRGAPKIDMNKPMSPQEAAKLPPGTPFIGLDGKRRIRK